MPEAGIKKLLGEKIEDPDKLNGTPRAELYLLVDEPQNILAEHYNMGLKN